MAIFAYTHAEVVRFYVTVNVASFVDIFQGTEHLVEQEETCFEGEMFLGHHCFQAFEGGTHQIHNHEIYIGIAGAVVDVGDASIFCGGI